MAIIQVLSDLLASQVAAGEVVERPASVIKELVENSLDANASTISVLARRGGTALLKVVDDGLGMDRDDAVRCLERHATSKIRTSEDLAVILTKGFRGEALPSIASVSKFALSTRPAGALTGTRVVVEGGKLLEVSDAGDAPGTQIEIRQLFYNVPARRKFLRSEDTEFSHIEQQVRVQALAHPEVGFSLTRDDRCLFHLPPGGKLLERIVGLTGPDLTDRLLEVPETERGPIVVSGFIGEAGLLRANRALQFIFLNRRPVESPVFSHAVRGGYGEALARGQSPVIFLRVEIDPAAVDVNVHPAKREVRFRNGLSVQTALSEIIAETLRRGRSARVSFSAPPESTLPTEPWEAPVPVPRWTPAEPPPALLPGLEGENSARQASASESDYKPSAETAYQPDREAATAVLTSDGENGRKSGESDPQWQPGSEAPAQIHPPPEFRVVGLLGGQYAIMESAEGLVLMDHRAAWERVLFEEARGRASRQAVESQVLLTPLTVPLSPREFDFLKPNLPALRRMGIGVEEFGPNTVMVDSLPVFWESDGATATLLSGLLDDLRHAGDRAPSRRLDDESIAAAVARQAARRQLPQSETEAADLVRRLMACEMPYCCPAGRPTIIQLSFQELARKFGRG